MSIITHDYLTQINNKYNLSNLLPYIKTRYNRKSFERVIACMLQINNKNKSFFGDFKLYWGNDLHKGKLESLVNKELPILKVWSSR